MIVGGGCKGSMYLFIDVWRQGGEYNLSHPVSGI